MSNEEKSSKQEETEEVVNLNDNEEFKNAVEEVENKLEVKPKKENSIKQDDENILHKGFSLLNIKSFNDFLDNKWNIMNYAKQIGENIDETITKSYNSSKKLYESRKKYIKKLKKSKKRELQMNKVIEANALEDEIEKEKQELERDKKEIKNDKQSATIIKNTLFALNKILKYMAMEPEKREMIKKVSFVILTIIFIVFTTSFIYAITDLFFINL